MTTALATQVIANIDDLQRIAKLLAASGYFDAKGNGEAAIAQIATKILAGQEMGYGPFASVQGIHVIQGRPAMSANLMAAAVKASQRYDYRVRQMDDAVVSIEFFERVSGKLESIGISTFTAEDARRAGTQNLQKFPRNMLFARALSNGVRWYCPDVFHTAVYTPEELGATTGADANVIDGTYAAVDPTTGEISPSPAPNPGEIPPEVAEWTKPDDAYEWAVGIGAADNVFAARNAMRRIVDAHGGRLTKENAPAIYLAFYNDRQKRAQEKAQAAVPEPEQDPDGVFA